jgi:hypothetical protein
VDLNREEKICKLNVRSSVEEPALLVSSENTHHIDKKDFPQVSRIRYILTDLSVEFPCKIADIGHLNV